MNALTDYFMNDVIDRGQVEITLESTETAVTGPASQRHIKEHDLAYHEEGVDSDLEWMQDHDIFLVEGTAYQTSSLQISERLSPFPTFEPLKFSCLSPFPQQFNEGGGSKSVSGVPKHRLRFLPFVVVVAGCTFFHKVLLQSSELNNVLDPFVLGICCSIQDSDAPFFAI